MIVEGSKFMDDTRVSTSFNQSAQLSRFSAQSWVTQYATTIMAIGMLMNDFSCLAISVGLSIWLRMKILNPLMGNFLSSLVNS